MKKAELRQLQEIADLISDADLADLAELQKKQAELARQAEALSETYRTTPGTDGIDPALRAGVGPLWDIWRQEQLRDLQMKRARLAAEVEAARQKASRSFGRATAISELLAREF